MKTLNCFLALLVGGIFCAPAQVQTAQPVLTNATISSKPLASAPLHNSRQAAFQGSRGARQSFFGKATNSATNPFALGASKTVISSTVSERGADYRVWRQVSAVTNSQGTVSLRTNSFTELATGMHFRDPESGQWKETRELIEPVAGGAVARYGPHKVIFAENLNTVGAVDLETPDGKRLRSHVLGLSYTDTASGKSVLIAEIKDCRGQIVGANQVIYADAFTELKADVRYTYTKAGFEQDLILRAQPPSPKEFGLSPDTTHLQVLTEFLNPPVPAKSKRALKTSKGEAMNDESLDFGVMRIGEGRAFALGQEDESAAPTAKQWQKVAGRDLLIEEVAMPELLKELGALPKSAALTTPNKNVRLAKLERQLPARLTTAAKGATMLAAKTLLAQPGVVLDYLVTLTGQSGCTLKGDTTYYVSGTVNLNGTTIIESGTVVKYANTSATRINFTGPVVCQTSAYRPAIFTSKDDDTVGETIAGSTHNPVKSTLNKYLLNSGSAATSYKYLRFAYAGTGLQDPHMIDIGHSQFLNCNLAIYSDPGTIELRNVLFVQCSTCVKTPDVVYGEHLTVDGCPIFANSKVMSGSIVNSMFTGVTTVGNVTLYYSQSRPSSSGIYQTVGGGSHYLAPPVPGDGRHNAGTTNINASLLASLKTKTTCPPIVFPAFMKLTGELTLFPQVPRYVSGNPDLGYYYDVLDFSVAQMFVEGGSITVEPGTAIGVRSDPVMDLPQYPQLTVGFLLWENSRLLSHGTATSPITFTSAKMVQEAPSQSYQIMTFVSDFEGDPAADAPPVFDFRFCNFSGFSTDYLLTAGSSAPMSLLWNPAAANSSMHLSLRDCNLFGGQIDIGMPTYRDYLGPDASVSLVNNLFHRVAVSINPTWAAAGPTPVVNMNFLLEAYNNIFREEFFALGPLPDGYPVWTLKDNLFDKMVFVSTGVGHLDHDYNAYWLFPESLLQWPESNRLMNYDGSPNPAHDVIPNPTTWPTPGYQTGPLGSFYLNLTTSSPLYNAGSRTPAAAALYHYTTQLNQAKEANQAAVNSGLHYVATASASSTSPTDSDVGGPDGIPDYVENWHGDGDTGANRTHTADETDWRNPTTDTDPITSAPIADAVNRLYDDIDLSGSGLSGRVKKALSLSPFSTSNPLVLTPAGAGAVPNTYSFAVAPLSYDQLASVGSLEILADGLPVLFWRTDRQADGSCLVTWDGTFEGASQRIFQLGIHLDGQTIRGGVGSVSIANANLAASVYAYPLRPGTYDWVNTEPYDRVDSTFIPQTWRNNASSWQLFCSALSNPYFDVLCPFGESMTRSYSAARQSTVLSILSAVDSSPDIGQNVLRFLRSSEGALFVEGSGNLPVGSGGYMVACNMAGLDSALNSLNQADLQKLFRLAAWDARKVLASQDYFTAAAPLRLMYTAYQRLSPPPAGVTLTPLTAEQFWLLDSGYFPSDFLSVPGSAVTALGLTSRP